jgi:hypothetical protein
MPLSGPLKANTSSRLTDDKHTCIFEQQDVPLQHFKDCVQVASATITTAAGAGSTMALPAVHVWLTRLRMSEKPQFLVSVG